MSVRCKARRGARQARRARGPPPLFLQLRGVRAADDIVRIGAAPQPQPIVGPHERRVLEQRTDNSARVALPIYLGEVEHVEHARRSRAGVLQHRLQHVLDCARDADLREVVSRLEGRNYVLA